MPSGADDAISTALSGELRYSRVWEDHRLLERGLAVGPGDDLLLIASAGCNVLNLLLREPRRIVALDCNPAQVALLELKLAGIRTLGASAFHELLGVVPGDALACYERVRGALPADARAWWDAHPDVLASGVERAGRLDRFIAGFARAHVSPALADRLFAIGGRAVRRRFVDDELVTPAFERAFLDWFAREALAARGRHPAQQRYVEEMDVAAWFLARLRWACTELPVQGNFYLERFLQGERTTPRWLPPYLAPGLFPRLRALVDRVEVVTAPLDAWLDTQRAGSLSGAGLSDVFEYLSPDATAVTFASLARVVRDEGRVAYWNLLVARESPASLRHVLRPLDRLSRALWRRDRSWFYRAFHVEQVAPRATGVAMAADLPDSLRVPARGRYDEDARRARLAWIAGRTGAEPAALDGMRLRAESLVANAENVIGAVEIPVGLAGPLLFDGRAVRGVLHAPMATTEGALVASASRGATAITRAGGVRTRVLVQRMTRAPAFAFDDPRDAVAFAAWIAGQREALRAKVAEVSRHARLVNIEPRVIGSATHVVFAYTTRDAAGQNMTTAATWHACQWVLGELPALGLVPRRFVVEANMSGDKKGSARVAGGGRGCSAVAECTLDAEVLRQVLHASPDEMVEVWALLRDGGSAIGMHAHNVNVANVVAAIFTATGQDIACVHESACGELALHADGRGLHARLDLPRLVVGSVGGGTHLPAQQASLALLGCAGEGGARRLAEAIAGFALSLELSTLAAIASGEFATAHERLGRNRPVVPLGERDLVPSFFEVGLRRALGDGTLRITSVEPIADAGGASILGDLTSRRFRKTIGVLHRRLHHDAGATDVVVKVKPLDAEVQVMMRGLAVACGRRVAEAWAQHGDAAGFTACHERELAIYAQDDPRFVRHAPRIHDTVRDPRREAYALVLERLHGRVRLLDSADDPSGWGEAELTAAIRGAGALHAMWLGRERELLAMPWIGTPPSASRMEAMRPLWRAIAEFGAEEFPAMLDADALRLHLDLIDTIPAWWPRLERMPRTLAHHDFNPRNIALRETPAGLVLCAYDWELATVHLPQHDVAELLAFVLSDRASATEVATYVELHRRSVIEAGGVGVPDAATWREGFALAARDLLVARFGLYLMGHRARHYDFLERTLRTLRHLVRLGLERA